MEKPCSEKVRKFKNFFFLSGRDLILIAIFSIAGLAIHCDFGGLSNRYFIVGWPTPLCHLAFRGGHYSPDLETKWIVTILLCFALLPVFLYIVFAKQIYKFRQKHGKLMSCIIYGIPVVAVIASFEPEFVFLMLPWINFWFVGGCLLIYAYRMSHFNWFTAIVAGLLHFLYAVVFSFSMIITYCDGTDIITIVCDDNLFPLHYLWAEKLFPMVAILLLMLPLSVIVVLVRKLNWKLKICYLVPGIFLWFYLTEFPCTKYKMFLNGEIPIEFHCSHYHHICLMAGYRPKDKSLIRRIEARKKKNNFTRDSGDN